MTAKTVLTSLVAGGLSLLAVPPAGAQSPEVASGRLCTYQISSVYNGEIDHVTLSGGPLAATAPGATISLTCTFQVGWDNRTHAGADAVAASSPPSSQVATIPPTPGSYAVPTDALEVICTQATVDGVTYYYDTVFGAWSTDDGVRCRDNEPVNEPPPPPLPPVFRAVQTVLDLLTDPVDPAVCPVLATLAPGVPGVAVTPDGDVRVADEPFMYWNCP